MKTVFDYRSYKSYVTDSLDDLQHAKSGQRSRLARFIPCHSAYVSQVLNGNAHFSLEQGEKINTFLGHTEEESLFFLTLIQFERAGTTSLQNLFKKQLDAMLKKRDDLKQRLTYDKTLDAINEGVYYSSWHYAAIHVLVSIPNIDSKDAIARTLKVSNKRVAEVLEFLCRVGLVAEKKGKYSVGVNRIHLGSDSPHIGKHHTNWRFKAINSLDAPSDQDLHYSSVVTMSEKDAEKIRKILIEAIESVRAVVRASPEENIYCYGLDFFPVA